MQLKNSVKEIYKFKNKILNRRELIKKIALITGTALIGGEYVLTGCKNNDKPVKGIFTETDILFFDEVAETIIPKTNTPGAKEAAVGKFMALFSTDCYDTNQITTLKNGIDTLNDTAIKKYKYTFIKISADQKKQLLTEIDAEAKNELKKNSEASANNTIPHYFILMKQLVLLGFFTSKPGATQVLRYNPVPGKYEGCINYKEGETSWA